MEQSKKNIKLQDKQGISSQVFTAAVYQMKAVFRVCAPCNG
jgi:hypothetical protein